jgi:hypothetical protein
MKIEIVTKFETSHVGNNDTTIEARILTDTGIEICSGTDKDSWPDPKKSPASAKRATKAALERMQYMLDNVIDVAKKAGLL